MLAEGREESLESGKYHEWIGMYPISCFKSEQRCINETEKSLGSWHASGFSWRSLFHARGTHVSSPLLSWKVNFWQVEGGAEDWETAKWHSIVLWRNLGGKICTPKGLDVNNNPESSLSSVIPPCPAFSPFLVSGSKGCFFFEGGSDPVTMEEKPYSVAQAKKNVLL